METLQPSLWWELNVLSRAVVYPNLTAAAAQVGISQPQLSRIIGKLESEFGITLLDRSIRRKSSWNPIAHHLAETYVKAAQGLNANLQKALSGGEPSLLKIGVLEGLITQALSLSKVAFAKSGIHLLEVDVYDLNILEELFLKNELDVILTSREPGRKKFKHSRILGYQSLNFVQGKEGSILAMSSFEYGMQPAKRKSADRVLISNSLAVKRGWIEKCGGSGSLPTELGTKKTQLGVYMIGLDSLSDKVWSRISNL